MSFCCCCSHLLYSYHFVQYVEYLLHKPLSASCINTLFCDWLLFVSLLHFKLFEGQDFCLFVSLVLSSQPDAQGLEYIRCFLNVGRMNEQVQEKNTKSNQSEAHHEKVSLLGFYKLISQIYILNAYEVKPWFLWQIWKTRNESVITTILSSPLFYAIKRNDDFCLTRLLCFFDLRRPKHVYKT